MKGGRDESQSQSQATGELSKPTGPFIFHFLPPFSVLPWATPRPVEDLMLPLVLPDDGKSP